VALQVGSEMGNGYSGNYGDMVDLQPASMTSIEVPGDKFHFQAYVMDVETSGTGIPTGYAWKDFRDFEDIQLEDTNTVQPFSFQLGIDDSVILSDGSVVTPTFPYMIRAEYKPAGASTSLPSYSEIESVNVEQNPSTSVAFSTHGTVRHAGTTFYFNVAPNSGVGTIRVTVQRSGTKTLTYNVTTDETGNAGAVLKLGSKTGKYKVSAKFLGNRYGVGSTTVSRTINATK